MMNEAEVIIVGGGPAGLNCALILGRCCRKVIIFDDGRHRNSVSRSLHGILSRDGIDPKDFLEQCIGELGRYDVRIIHESVKGIEKEGENFILTADVNKMYMAKKVLLATGIRDTLPEIDGIEKFYGTSVFHCPYCDGWEFRHKPWAIYTHSRAAAVEVCLRFRTWTDDITLLSGYTRSLSRTDKEILSANGIRLYKGLIKNLEGGNGLLKSLVFADGSRFQVSALFFHTRHNRQNTLGNGLNCRLSKRGRILCNRLQQTNVRGLYAAGDASGDISLAVIAAAEGARAAIAIDAELNRDSRAGIN